MQEKHSLFYRLSRHTAVLFNGRRRCSCCIGKSKRKQKTNKLNVMQCKKCPFSITFQEYLELYLCGKSNKDHLPFSPDSSGLMDATLICWEVEVVLLLIKIECSSIFGLATVVFVRFFVCSGDDLCVPWAHVVFALQISQFLANDSWCCGLQNTQKEKQQNN